MCVCVCVYLLRTCSINKHAKDAEYVELCKWQEFLSFRFCVGLHIVHIPNANPPGQEMSSCSWHSLINTLSCYRALRKSNIHLLNPNDWDTKSMGGKVTSQGRSVWIPTKMLKTLEVSSIPYLGLLDRVQSSLAQINQQTLSKKGSDLPTWQACKMVILFFY